MSRSPSRITASVAIATLLAAPVAGEIAWPWRPKIAAGEIVRFSGTVVDLAGQPLSDVDVVVEGWRTGIDVRAFARVRSQRVHAAARTNERGEYAIDWTWDPRLHHFEVSAVAPYRSAGGDTSHTLARVDVTRRLRSSRAIVALLSVGTNELAFLRRLLEFERSLSSPDEHATYAELGLPEQLDQSSAGATDESAWWYYSTGRVCRFRNGVRVEVESFTPVGSGDDEVR